MISEIYMDRELYAVILCLNQKKNCCPRVIRVINAFDYNMKHNSDPK
jgi:hypothetical protein